jgi:hypothetical protein
MKIVILIFTEVYESRVMEMLTTLGVDSYTCWEHVKGKGPGTEPHLGTRSFPSIDAVMMLAIPEESLLEKLCQAVVDTNKKIVRADDHIRLFQTPLERII